MEMKKPSQECIDKMNKIMEPLGESINLLMEVKAVEADIAIMRLKEGAMWAQQAVINIEEKESK